MVSKYLYSKYELGDKYVSFYEVEVTASGNVKPMEVTL